MDLSNLRPSGFNLSSYQQQSRLSNQVAQRSGFVELDTCPICDSDKKQYISEKFHSKIVSCGQCNIWYADRFPKDFADLYSTNDYLEVAIDTYDESREFRKRTFGKERVAILEQYKSAGSKLLDVGCGTGWFLESAMSTFDCHGAEYSKDLRAWLEKKLGIHVKESMQEFDIQFDIITLFDVIEHVPNPKQLIDEIYHHLAPGGIALIYTPNMDSLAFNLIPHQYNNLICPPSHLFYFSPKTFKHLVNQKDLNIVDISTHGLDIYDLFSYMNDHDVIDNTLFRKDHTSESLAAAQENLDKHGFANHMRVVIQKNEQ